MQNLNKSTIKHEPKQLMESNNYRKSRNKRYPGWHRVCVFCISKPKLLLQLLLFYRDPPPEELPRLRQICRILVQQSALA